MRLTALELLQLQHLETRRQLLVAQGQIAGLAIEREADAVSRAFRTRLRIPEGVNVNVGPDGTVTVEASEPSEAAPPPKAPDPPGLGKALEEAIARGTARALDEARAAEPADALSSLYRRGQERAIARANGSAT